MDGIPVYSLVAWSGTGKTTYLEGLIPALKALGLTVGVVKHDGHDFEIDHPGKDSWRYAQAGAAVTAVVSYAKAAFVEHRPLTPEEAVTRVTGVDLILTEGFKNGPWPKLALCRAGHPPAVEDCVALITDGSVENGPVPTFSIHDPVPLARWLAGQVKERII